MPLVLHPTKSTRSLSPPSTPDYTFPAVATQVQAALGIQQGFAFDIQAVCAGFVFALANANGLILGGQAKRGAGHWC